MHKLARIAEAGDGTTATVLLHRFLPPGGVLPEGAAESGWPEGPAEISDDDFGLDAREVVTGHREI
jgi:hypothetical protein